MAGPSGVGSGAPSSAVPQVSIPKPAVVRPDVRGASTMPLPVAPTAPVAPPVSAPSPAVPAPAVAPAQPVPAGVVPAPPSFAPPTAPGAVPGVPGVSGGASAAVRRVSRKTIAVISTVVAAVIAVALAFIIPNFTAVKAALGFRPNNPLVVTMDALNSLTTLRSAKYEAKFSANGSSATFSGLYSLGSTTDDSSAMLTFDADDSKGSIAWYKGAVAAGGGYQDEDYSYYYYDADQLESTLRDGMGGDAANFVMDVKDALIKNGRIDVEGTEQTVYDKLDSLSDEYNVDEIERFKDTQPSAAVKSEASKLMQHYFGVELEKKEAIATIFPMHTSQKSGGTTQLDYRIDLKALAQHFVSYWTAHETEYPQLRAWVINQIKDSGVDDAESEYRKALDQVRKWDFGTGSEVKMPYVEVSLNYGGKRMLNSISVHAEYDGDSVDGSLSLSGQNLVSASDTQVTEFVDKAKANNQAE